jgi:hypothetical protein
MTVEERQRALASLGIAPVDPRGLLWVARQAQNIIFDTFFDALSDRQTARRIALGVPSGIVSLEELQRRAATQRDGLRRALDLLNRNEVLALRVEGDMGLEACKVAYRAMGFTRIRPDTYPHQQETQGILPGPLSPGNFTDLAEQLYANKTAHLDHVELFETVAKITAMVAVTVALILIANAAGAALAATIFGTAGTATAIAEVAFSAAIFTALSAGADWAFTGRAPVDPNDPSGSAARLGGHFLLNLAMFGFFRVPNVVFSAAGRAGARAIFGLSEEAAGASRAATALRLTATGATFVGGAMAEFRAANGRWPNAREAGLLVYQSLATLACSRSAAPWPAPTWSGWRSGSAPGGWARLMTRSNATSPMSSASTPILSPWPKTPRTPAAMRPR